LSSFGLSGTVGVGIEIDNALRLRILLEKARLELLAADSEAEDSREDGTREVTMAKRASGKSARLFLMTER
jgi:hypothetical protein